MELLQLRNINKEYKLNSNEYFQALKDVNVSFKRGELVSIIGESGSGKSTLMNLIGGLDSHFEGQLLFEGKNLLNFSERELDEYRKNKIGFIFQSCNLIPHLSILDNVTIALTLSNISKEERIERAKTALRQVGLESQINKKPNQLSGGQRQRVAIARALINDPEIILADEPTGALDSQTTEQVLNIIKDIANRGKLVIMVTHSQKVAANSSRTVKIFDGKIIEDKLNEDYMVEVIDEVALTVDENEKQVDKGKQNLSLFSSIKLAANNMRQKLKRNILVALGVSIGIMSVVMMLSLGDGLKAYFSSMIDSFMNPLVVEVSMPQERVDSNDAQNPMSAMMGTKSTFKKKNLDELSKIDGVKKVEKGFQYLSMPGMNILKYKDDESDLMGLSSMSSVLTNKNVSKGKLPSKNEILINKSVANDLGEDIIGKTVQLNAVVEGQSISGEFVVSGIYTAGKNNNMADSNNSAYVNFDDIKGLLKEEGKTLEPNLAFLVADDADVASNIKDEITDLGYGGSTQEVMGDQMLTMLDVLTVALSGIAGISLVVSSIMILVVLYISVVERTKEIGLLRAIGARSKDIKRIFVSEAFLIGLLSGVIGIFGAYLMSIVVNNISINAFDMKVMNITVTYAMIGVLIATLVSMIAGLFPANKAAKLDPVDSLRTE